MIYPDPHYWGKVAEHYARLGKTPPKRKRPNHLRLVPKPKAPPK